MASCDHSYNRPPCEPILNKRKFSYSSEPTAERFCSTSPGRKMLAAIDKNNNVKEICPAINGEQIFYSRKGTIPDELQSHFASMTAGINFGLRHSQLEPKLQVIYQGQHYQFHSFLPDETSWWKCVHHHLQNCRAMIGINAEMARVFTVKKVHKHNPDAEKMLGCPQGKGVTICNGSEKTFWLTYGTGPVQFWQRSRNLILDGYSYYLKKIQKINGSVWHCCGFKCKSRLSIQGVFRQIKQIEQHNHGPIPEGKMAQIRAVCNVDLDLAESKENQPSTEIKRTITYDGQSFCIQTKETEGTRLWCCLWRDLRNCPVTVRMSCDDKHVALVAPEARHNHPDDLVGVYLHADGWYSVFDKQEKNEFIFLLFTVEPTEREMARRGMIYQGYKYVLTTITDRGDSEWKCPACEASLQIAGLFSVASQRGNHSHRQLSIEEINAFMKNSEESNHFLSNNNVPLSKSALLATFSALNPNRNFQLCHQDGNMKILQDGFEYLYVCSKPNYSLWRCIYSTIRCCDATLRVDNDDLRSPHTAHNHSVELWDLFYTALGQHTILDEVSNTRRTFHFLIQPTFERPLPHVLFEGHLFALNFITESGNASLWACSGTGCRVTLTVTGQFEKMCVEGLPHKELPLAGEEQTQWMKRYGSSDSF